MHNGLKVNLYCCEGGNVKAICSNGKTHIDSDWKSKTSLKIIYLISTHLSSFWTEDGQP
jgi:hypothetical protein